MNLFDRIKNIVLNPKEEWNVISEENSTNTQIITNYLLILAFIPALGQFIRYGFIGYKLPFGEYVEGVIALGVRYASIAYISGVLGVFISAYLIDMLAPNFGTPRNFNKTLQWLVYSFTPFFVAGIFYMVPAVSFLTLVGLFGFYLMYVGIAPVLQTPGDRISSFFIVSVLVVIAVYLILGIILTRIFIPGILALPGMSL